MSVEEYTLGKAANLVLNVDGCIGALFLDLLSSSGAFTKVEMDQVGADIKRGEGGRRPRPALASPTLRQPPPLA